MATVLARPAHAADETYLSAEALSVDISGRETFSTVALDPDYYYHAIVTGVVHIVEHSLFASDQLTSGDPLYLTDAVGNFTRREEDRVRFSARSRLITEDRVKHRYVFRLTGNGERLSISFPLAWAPPDVDRERLDALHVVLMRSGRLTFWERFSGEEVGTSLKSALGWVLLALVIVTPVILLILHEIRSARRRSVDGEAREKAHRQGQRIGRIREARKARELADEKGRKVQAARAEEERRMRERLAQQEKEIRERFTRLCHKYEKLEHYGDPKFLEDHARKYRQKLIADRDQIIKEYLELKADEPMIAMLEKEAPHIFGRAIWRIEALAWAEKLDVSEPPARKKKSPEEFRAIKTTFELHRARDKIESAKTKLESLRDMKEMLDQFEPMDPEDRERLERELKEQILSEREEQNENQGKILGSPNGR
jgi:hypothetical protein